MSNLLDQSGTPLLDQGSANLTDQSSSVTITLPAGTTTWTVPSDCNLIDSLTLQAAGASGAGPGTTTGQAGGGGGSGAEGVWLAISVTPNSTITVSVGAGGVQRTGSVGQDGGNVSFGPVGANTYGPVAGGVHGVSGTGGTGGAGGAGGASPSGLTPAPSTALAGTAGAAGVASTGPAGHGGDAPGTTGTGGPGGTTSTLSGTDGSAPGAGGGGGFYNGTVGEHSGKGGDAQITITYTPTTTTKGLTDAGGAVDSFAVSVAGGMVVPLSFVQGSAIGTGNGSADAVLPMPGGSQIDSLLVAEAASQGDAFNTPTGWQRATSRQLPPARVALLMGFDVARGGWTAANSQIGPGDTHRIFYGGNLPASFDSDGTPANVTCIVSYKVTGTNFASYVNSIPANRQVILIFHHEPEGDTQFTGGADFVSQFKAQSDSLRALGCHPGGSHPNVRIAMCAAGFPYRNNGTADVLAGNYLRGLGATSPASGWPYVDMFTKDIYQGSGGTGDAVGWSTNGLANNQYWQNWLGLVTDPSVVGTVQPLGITEYGVDDPVGNTARNTRIKLDLAYLAANSFNGAPWQMMCYWWESLAGDPNQAQFTDAPTIATWQQAETGYGARTVIYYWPNNPGGITRITAATTGNQEIEAAIQEYSSPAGSIQQLDSVGSNIAAAGQSSLQIIAGSANSGGDLAVGVWADAFAAAQPGTAWGIITGWQRDSSLNSDLLTFWAGHDLSVPAGTLSATQTYSTITGSNGWSGCLATFSAISTATVPVGVTDSGAATDSLAVTTGTGTPVPIFEMAAGIDELDVVQTAQNIPLTEASGAADGLEVVVSTVLVPAPKTLPVASPAFIRSAMPRMHIQNLITGKWVSRDVQNVVSPSITWNLVPPDAFTCSITPVRDDLRSPSTGQPLIDEWVSGVYLEENGEIKYGGIVVGGAFQGPRWDITTMGFAGYANGMPYEGSQYSHTDIDALDVVRDLWHWLQTQPGGNINLELDNTKSGVLLGHFVQSGAWTELAANISAGAKTVKVLNANPFTKKMKIAVGDTDNGTIAKITKNAGGQVTGGSDGLTVAVVDEITLLTALKNSHARGEVVEQTGPAPPFVLDWWNSTDIGQEIQQIQAEAVFDMIEQHQWADPGKTGVRHFLHFGVPRVGARKQLRFAEGENIIQPAQVTRDGTNYFNNIVGIGAGQGSETIRQTASVVDGRLRRTQVYQDQTVKSDSRMAAKARKQLTATTGLDTVTQIVITNHPNAPFGTFRPGDDIPVTLGGTGWRRGVIWSRIISMTQDPTTNLMTINLLRSDSFSYMAPTGTAGTI